MKKLLVILLLSIPAFSQGLGNLSLKHFQGVPTGNCSKNTLAENDLTGFLYSCDASQSPPQWSSNSFSGICTGAGNCTISGNLTVASGITYLHNPFNGDGTPIEGTTGVTVGLGAEPVLVGGNYQLKKCNTTNTTTPCWPVVAQRVGSVFTFSGSFTTGFAYIPSTGSSTTVTLDNTCTGPDGSGVGAHYLIRSPTVSGQYHDTGSSTAPTSGWYLGRCATSGTGAQSALIEPQVAGGAGGGTTLTSNFTYTTGFNSFGYAGGGVTTVVPSIAAINNISIQLLDVPVAMTIGHATVSQAGSSNQANTICDFGIYTDGGAGTASLTTHSSYNCNTGPNGAVTWATGAITLTPGTRYWAASCTSNITATAAAFFGIGLNAATTNQLNKNAIRFGQDTTDLCTVGVLPATITIANIAATTTANPVAIILEP